MAVNDSLYLSQLGHSRGWVQTLWAGTSTLNSSRVRRCGGQRALSVNFSNHQGYPGFKICWTHMNFEPRTQGRKCGTPRTLAYSWQEQLARYVRAPDRQYAGIYRSRFMIQCTSYRTISYRVMVWTGWDWWSGWALWSSEWTVTARRWQSASSSTHVPPLGQRL